MFDFQQKKKNNLKYILSSKYFKVIFKTHWAKNKNIKITASNTSVTIQNGHVILFCNQQSELFPLLTYVSRTCKKKIILKKIKKEN